MAGFAGRAPWGVVRGAGAMVSMAGGIQSKCLAMKKAAMNAAIILKLGVSQGYPVTTKAR